jgi:hypothetical protein
MNAPVQSAMHALNRFMNVQYHNECRSQSASQYRALPRPHDTHVADLMKPAYSRMHETCLWHTCTFGQPRYVRTASVLAKDLPWHYFHGEIMGKLNTLKGELLLADDLRKLLLV